MNQSELKERFDPWGQNARKGRRERSRPLLSGKTAQKTGKTRPSQGIPQAASRAAGTESRTAARGTVAGRIVSPLHTEHSVDIDSSQDVQQAQGERTAAPKRNTRKGKTKKK